MTETAFETIASAASIKKTQHSCFQAALCLLMVTLRTHSKQFTKGTSGLLFHLSCCKREIQFTILNLALIYLNP